MIFDGPELRGEWYDSRHIFTGEELPWPRFCDVVTWGWTAPKKCAPKLKNNSCCSRAEHAEKDHGISAAMLPPSILAMVKSAIKDE